MKSYSLIFILFMLIGCVSKTVNETIELHKEAKSKPRKTICYEIDSSSEKSIMGQYCLIYIGDL